PPDGPANTAARGCSAIARRRSDAEVARHPKRRFTEAVARRIFSRNRAVQAAVRVDDAFDRRAAFHFPLLRALWIIAREVAGVRLLPPHRVGDDRRRRRRTIRRRRWRRRRLFLFLDFHLHRVLILEEISDRAEALRDREVH